VRIPTIRTGGVREGTTRGGGEPINLMDKTDASHGADAGGLTREFADLLRCPNCPGRPPITYRPVTNTLDCGACGRRYPILDGLPDLRAGGAEADAEKIPAGES